MHACIWGMHAYIWGMAVGMRASMHACIWGGHARHASTSLGVQHTACARWRAVCARRPPMYCNAAVLRRYDQPVPEPGSDAYRGKGKTWVAGEYVTAGIGIWYKARVDGCDPATGRVQVRPPCSVCAEGAGECPTRPHAYIPRPLALTNHPAEYGAEVLVRSSMTRGSMECRGGGALGPSGTRPCAANLCGWQPQQHELRPCLVAADVRGGRLRRRDPPSAHVRALWGPAAAEPRVPARLRS